MHQKLWEEYFIIDAGSLRDLVGELLAKKGHYVTLTPAGDLLRDTNYSPHATRKMKEGS